jgi:glycerol uptake facilitator protein
MSTPLANRLAAEVVGTFLLVGLGAGSAVAVAAAEIAPSGLIAVALAHAIALAIGVYAFGAISGAHFNPSVTIALAATRRLPWGEAPAYIGAQLVGGALGAAAILAVYGGFAIDSGLGATFVGDNFNLFQGALAEVIGTFVLVTAIFALAVDPRGAKQFVGLGIGLGLGVAILVVGPVSGASLNLARTLGPELMLTFGSGDAHWGQILVYLIAPVVGAVLAAFVYDAVARPRAVQATPAEAIVETRSSGNKSRKR